LVASQPEFGRRGEPLPTIAGLVPSLTRLPSGCRFRDRCALSEPDCARIDPNLIAYGPTQRAACIVTTAMHGARS